MTGYLANETDPVPLVQDLRITHERFGSTSDPTLNGHLHYPNDNDMDRSLNKTATDKIRKYRVDYNDNPPDSISFIPDIVSTSGRLHSEFVCLIFLQTPRETDRFFCTFRSSSCTIKQWTVPLPPHDVVLTTLKSKVGNTSYPRLTTESQS